MKTDDLRAQGLTDEQIAYVMAENGKDIKNAKKDLEDITAERDKWKESAENASATLKGFDGVNVEQLKADIEALKKKNEDAENDYRAKIAERDFTDSLDEAIRSANGRNAKAIKALLDVNALRESKNQKEDIKMALDALVEAEDSKMLFGVKENEDDKKKAKFTQQMGGSTGGSNVTKESIMSIKDRAERRKMISEHMALFTED